MFKPTCIKIGGGFGQNEIGIDGFFVSGYFDGINGTDPKVIGNRQLQQISEIGFMNLEEHDAPAALAWLESVSIRISMLNWKALILFSPYVHQTCLHQTQ